MNVLNTHKRNQSKAFTIVELLIVIVVITILAAISIAAYTSISQRAKNTAIINAASQSLKMIQTYIAQTGEYPLKTWVCVTVVSGCHTNGSVQSANTVFDSKMATIGSLPRSVPNDGDVDYGITYVYYSLITYDGQSQPLVLRYYLLGKDQKCGVPGVAASVGSSSYEPSTTGYTSYSSSRNKTTCYVSVPGPAS